MRDHTVGMKREIGNMHDLDTSERKGCYRESKEVEGLRKTWKILSRAVIFIIVFWFLAAFARMILLLGMSLSGNRFLKESGFFEEWSALDVTRYVRFATGAGMGILTVKMLALLVCRAGWLKRIRRSSGQFIVRRNPLRWLFIIPAQCLLDIILAIWGFFIEEYIFMEQCEFVEQCGLGMIGHPSGMLAFAVLFWGIPVITLVAAVISTILTCVSYYRGKGGY